MSSNSSKIKKFFIILFVILASVCEGQVPQWVVYTTQNSGLPSNNINCVAIDSNNIKWIGTREGLVKLESNTMTVYNTSNSGIPDNNVRRIAIDNKNVLWLGTFDKGIAKFDRINWQTYDTLNSGLASNRIRDIQIFQDIKWIGTGDKGLVKYDNLNFITYNVINSGISNNYISSIALENNIKWLGANAPDGGLTRLSDTGTIIYLAKNSGIPSNVLAKIDFDYLNNLWIATYFGGGLAKFNYASNTWVVYNRSNSGLPDNNLLTVTAQKNIKWIGTLGAGLARFDDTSWVVFNPDNSPIPSISILQITPDKYGNIWIATVGGVAVYNSNGIVSIEPNQMNIPDKFILFQNYPNPFNPTTTISYQLPKSGLVSITGYDITGKEVAKLVNEFKEAGSYDITFTASNLSSGIYFYSLKADGFTDTKKMVVIK